MKIWWTHRRRRYVRPSRRSTDNDRKAVEEILRDINNFLNQARLHQPDFAARGVAALVGISDEEWRDNIEPRLKAATEQIVQLSS